MESIPTSQEQQLMRDYWLGALSAAEVERVENQWFETEEDAERLAAVRDDLIADYLNNDLSRGEKHLFEKNFLLVPANLRDAAITKSYRKVVDGKKVQEFGGQQVSKAASGSFPLWQRFNNLLAPQRARAALLTSMILVAGGVFILYQAVSVRHNPVNETAQINSPEHPQNAAGTTVLNDPEKSSGLNQGNSVNLNTAVNKDKTSIDKNSNLLRPDENALPVNKNSNPSKPDESALPKSQNSASSVVTLAFASTATRGAGGAPQSLVLNEETKIVRLLVPIKNWKPAYGEYEGTITASVDDKEIYRVKLGNLAKRAGKNVSIEIPARLLTSGDYYFSLAAKPVKDGKLAADPKLVDVYQFRVEKEPK